MKRSLLIFCFLLSVVAIQAQDVYNAVLISAQDVLDNPKSDDSQIKIAQFKLTALGYMHRKMIERNPDTPASELDMQAYCLSTFVTHFLSDIYKHRNDDNKQRVEYLKKYIEASAKNPMFGDKDTETTEVFICDGDNLTPFSLDTDWRRACETLSIE